MIDSSLEIGPANEKIRQKLMIPFSFVVSPGSTNSNIQTIEGEVQSFPRCQKCGAYFSKYCQKDESNSTWTCEICSHQNNTSKDENNDDSNKKLPEITLDDFQFVKTHQLGEEIIVLYISLNFHPKDFQIISTCLIDFFKKSNLSKPVIILLGQKKHDFSILAPYKSTYFRDPENNNVITKIKKDMNELESNEESKTNELPAPIFNLTSAQLQKEDISKFIFSPEQYPNIIKTIEKIAPIQKSDVSFNHFINAIDTLRLSIQSQDSQVINPIHYVSILTSISDYFSSRFAKKLYDTLIRVDIITPTYNDELLDAIQVIPGSISLFNSSNLVRNLCRSLSSPFLTKSSSEKVDDDEYHSKLCGYGKRGLGTVYQWNSYVRSNGCRTVWRLPKTPFCYDDKGVTFSPVLPSTEQPFVLDIHPDGTSDYATVQITAKMFMYTKSEKSDTPLFSSVFRVFNRKVRLSSDIKKIAQTINVNTLVWLWLTRTLEQSQREVLAALYRSTARIVKLLLNEDLEEDDQNQLKKSNDDQNQLKIQKLVHACCSLKLSNLMSQEDLNRNLARYSLVLSPPSSFVLVPKFDLENRWALFGNTVFYEQIVSDDQNEINSKGEGEDEKNDRDKHKKIVSGQFLDQLMDVLFMEKIESPIPEWCKSPDPQTLEFIHSLLSD